VDTGDKVVLGDEWGFLFHLREKLLHKHDEILGSFQHYLTHLKDKNRT
jgi:hypothetical protein